MLCILENAKQSLITESKVLVTWRRGKEKLQMYRVKLLKIVYDYYLNCDYFTHVDIGQNSYTVTIWMDWEGIMLSEISDLEDIILSECIYFY